MKFLFTFVLLAVVLSSARAKTFAGGRSSLSDIQQLGLEFSSRSESSSSSGTGFNFIRNGDSRLSQGINSRLNAALSLGPNFSSAAAQGRNTALERISNIVGSKINEGQRLSDVTVRSVYSFFDSENAPSSIANRLRRVVDDMRLNIPQNVQVEGGKSS